MPVKVESSFDPFDNILQIRAIFTKIPLLNLLCTKAYLKHGF